MTILKILKNTGIEIFLSYHPTILKFKREAKELHKELKSQKVSLMQCQEIIVKRNGFNNWHHLQQELKKFYQEDLNNSNLSISTNIEIGSSYILGYDKIFNHYKYQSLDLSLTHRLFLGKGVVRNYDEFIAKQSIKLGCPVLFVSNKDKDEINAFEDIISYATREGRGDNIKRIGINDYNLENNFNMFGASTLTELFFNLAEYEHLSEGKKDKFIAFASFFFMYLKDKQSKDKQFILSLEKMRDVLSTKDYLQDEDIPKHISLARKGWIENQDLETEEILYGEIKRLIDLNLFSFKTNTVSLNLVENKDSIYLVSADNVVCKLMAVLLKMSIGYILGTPISSVDYNYSGKKKRVPYSIFFRNVSLPKGFAVVPAQARSMRISMNIVYDNVENLQDIELQSLIANTNLKYLSHDYFNKIAHILNLGLKTVAYNKYVNEIDNQDYVHMIYKDMRYNISNKNIKL